MQHQIDTNQAYQNVSCVPEIEQWKPVQLSGPYESSQLMLLQSWRIHTQEQSERFVIVTFLVLLAQSIDVV